MIQGLFSENVKVIQGLAPAADAFAGTKTTDVVSLANYEKAVFVVERGAGDTGTSTFTLEASAANNGSSPTAVPYRYRVGDSDGTDLGAVIEAAAAGFSIAAGGNKLALLEVRADDLPAGKPWVHLKAVEVVDSPVAGSVLIGLLNPRYSGLTLPDAV